MKRICTTVFIFLSIFYSTQVFATCTYGRGPGGHATQTEDDRTGLINFGMVNLDSAYLQPVGTLLASIVVPSTSYNYGGANADTILWTCDTADLPNIQFLIATNGDDRVGGYWDLGKDDGIPNVYATYFQYVGIRQTMGGIVLTRFWQAMPITTYDEVDGKINIRLKDIPPIYAELYRISQLAPEYGSRSAYCGRHASGQISSGLYSCTQPNSYIQLQGPGLNSDLPGQDSNDHYVFWGQDNGYGYGMRTANTLTTNASCVARNATPLVLLRTMGVSDLNNGLSTQTNFNVNIECSNGVTSGTASGQTAIGFQVSAGALSAAQNLGLVNPSSGVYTLLSDNYGSDGIAKGVGIYLSNANSGENMIFVGAQNSNLGALSGWYPVLSGVTGQGTASSQAGYTNYTHTFTATLKKIQESTEPVEPGKVKSTAYVLVRVQ